MSTPNLQQSTKNYSKRSYMAASNTHSQINNSQDQSEYQIVIQFQLRRQREKTRILEQRLHNKQVFIQQMKEYQEELTLAFEKCQEELILAKKTLEQFHVVERDYIEEVAELKHLVIRLEDEINLREKNQLKRHFSEKKKQAETSPQRPMRAKTFMNDERPTDELEEELLRESKKIAKFITQFLVMVGCFCKQKETDLLKNRLKAAWKWIKQVVKEWSSWKKKKEQETNNPGQEDKSMDTYHQR